MCGDADDGGPKRDGEEPGAFCCCCSPVATGACWTDAGAPSSSSSSAAAAWRGRLHWPWSSGSNDDGDSWLCACSGRCCCSSIFSAPSSEGRRRLRFSLCTSAPEAEAAAITACSSGSAVSGLAAAEEVSARAPSGGGCFCASCVGDPAGVCCRQVGCGGGGSSASAAGAPPSSADKALAATPSAAAAALWSAKPSLPSPRIARARTRSGVNACGRGQEQAPAPCGQTPARKEAMNANSSSKKAWAARPYHLSAGAPRGTAALRSPARSGSGASPLVLPPSPCTPRPPPSRRRATLRRRNSRPLSTRRPG